MFLSAILMLICLSIASTKGHSIGKLFARQDVCNPSDQPVKACGTGDLTSASWSSFGIDAFLSNFINTFGPGTGTEIGFPAFFVQQNQVPGTPFTFDCSTILSTTCSHPTGTNPNTGTDCAFKDIPNIDQTVCSKYVTPQAAFVAENYIRLHQAVSNNFLAIGDAGNSILNSNFVNDVVDGLSEERGNILDAVFRAIAGFVIGLLPFGRAFTLGVKLFKGLDTIFSLAGQNKALTGPIDVIQTIQANQAIADLAARTKDQLTRQLQQMVASSQVRMLDSLNAAFLPGFGAPVGSAAEISFALTVPQGGVFLDITPTREDLAAVVATNLKNWIVSSTITGMGWNIILDHTPLFDDPADPGGVCRKGFKGIPKLLGSECALFRTGDVASKKPENPAIIENLINFSDAIQNAQECAGGKPDWAAVVGGTDNSATPLPRCLYGFQVTTLADRTARN